MKTIEARRVDMMKLKELLGLGVVPMSSISITLDNGGSTYMTNEGECSLRGNATITFKVKE